MTYPVRVVHVVSHHVRHLVHAVILLSLVHLPGVSVPQVPLYIGVR